MTHDEIIDRMGWSKYAKIHMYDMLDRIERIVRAAEKAEREACAKVCENEMTGVNPVGDIAREDCAAAIRARGQS